MEWNGIRPWNREGFAYWQSSGQTGPSVGSLPKNGHTEQKAQKTQQPMINVSSFSLDL